MQHSKNRLVAALTLILLSFTLTACPPKDRELCDEKIQNPEYFVELGVTHPVIKKLSQEFTLNTTWIAECFVENQSALTLQFEIPASYSHYNAPYLLPVYMTLWKDGRTEMEAYDVILADLETTIHTIETNPRIAEFLTQMTPEQGRPVRITDRVGIYGTLPSGQQGYVEIALPSGVITAYSLPNGVDWPSFPDVEQAHNIIEEKLLVNNLSGCQINTTNGHDYTSSKFHYQENGPWFLTVGLVCADGRKDAFVQLNPDGSYERLSIRTEY